MGLQFKWNPQKAEANFEKHGVTFVEAATVFADPLAGIKSDPDHSEAEDRYPIIGMSKKFRLLVVVFTERDRRFVLSAHGLQPKQRESNMSKDNVGKSKPCVKNMIFPAHFPIGMQRSTSRAQRKA